MLKDRLRCMLNLHRPVRTPIVEPALVPRANCRHCDQPIYREGPGKWRADPLVAGGGLPKQTQR